MESNLWGIDLGGTKVEGAILSSAIDPKVLFRDRLPTEGHKGYDHILGQIKAVVDKMEASAGYKPKKIGIATPGTLDPGLGLMKNSNSTVLMEGHSKLTLKKYWALSFLWLMMPIALLLPKPIWVLPKRNILMQKLCLV